MNRTIHLSSLLAARRTEILERWTQRISREHADKDLSRGELWAHLPLFFDQVLAALDSVEGAGDAHSEGVTASTDHGYSLTLQLPRSTHRAPEPLSDRELETRKEERLPGIDQVLSTRDIERITGRHRCTIYRWVCAGTFPAKRPAVDGAGFVQMSRDG